MKLLLTTLLLCVSCVNLISGANILIVYMMPSSSHYILGSGLARPLAEAGHDITFVSPFKTNDPPKNGSWTDIVLTGILEKRDNVNTNMFNMENVNPYNTVPFLDFLTKQMTEYTLEHEAVKDLLKSNATFDVVIIENFSNYALFGFANHYNASLILASSFEPSTWLNSLIAKPSVPSYKSDLRLSYSKDMTFFQRVNNVLFKIVYDLYNHFITFPAHDKLLKKHFPNAPDLEEIVYNASLVFVNSDIATNQPVPSVPSMVDIGGYHLQPVKKLPKDLQEFLDNAKEGVIYFSMGSVLKSSLLPEEKRNAFLKVFSKLKQKVLWKWEEENLPGQPPNVKIGKWLPQNDILAHPNVKLFITHGGFTSTTETVYHGVPVLVIPVFGDQKMNAQLAVSNGYGVRLPYGEVNEATLESALNEILNNPKYAENVKARSNILKDKITTPKERITFWVDYVIRHKGATHLRVEGLKLPWYKYLLLDVFAFLFSCVILFIFVVGFIFKKLLCKYKNTSKVKTN